MLVEGFGGGAPAKRLAGAGVEGESDRVEVVAAVAVQVGAFREVLAQQAVGVLVRAALPGTVRVAEVDGQAGVDAEPRVFEPSRILGPRSVSAIAARAA
jgi:hypothetical protein